jgi:hypothetical protein
MTETISQQTRLGELCRLIAETVDDDPVLDLIEDFLDALEHRANGTLH